MSDEKILSVTKLLDRIVELKAHLKNGDDSGELRKELSTTKGNLNKLIEVSDTSEVAAEFQRWLALHPDEKHAEQLLKRLTERRHG